MYSFAYINVLLHCNDFTCMLQLTSPTYINWLHLHTSIDFTSICSYNDFTSTLQLTSLVYINCLDLYVSLHWLHCIHSLASLVYINCIHLYVTLHWLHLYTSNFIIIWKHHLYTLLALLRLTFMHYFDCIACLPRHHLHDQLSGFTRIHT